MTIEYWTDEIRRAHMVNVANGILRQRFGLSSLGRSTKGPSFAGKAVLQRAMKNSSWIKRENPVDVPSISLSISKMSDVSSISRRNPDIGSSIAIQCRMSPGLA